MAHLVQKSVAFLLAVTLSVGVPVHVALDHGVPEESEQAGHHHDHGHHHGHHDHGHEQDSEPTHGESDAPAGPDHSHSPTDHAIHAQVGGSLSKVAPAFNFACVISIEEAPVFRPASIPPERSFLSPPIPYLARHLGVRGPPAAA